MMSGKDDADLDDLIQQGGDGSGGAANTLEMETLVGSKKTGGSTSENVFTPPPIPGGHLGAVCALCCYAVGSRPALSGITLSGMLIFFIVATFISAKHEIDPLKAAKIEHDYSTLQSQYDMSLAKIDHWCIFGGDDGCTCNDPLEPISRAELPGWMKTHKMNKNMLLSSMATGRDVDVAFIGDSITEEWNGRWAGRNMTRLAPIRSTFETYFKKDYDRIGAKEGGDLKGKYEGVALGINGDHSPHLLWRLQHGEMPGSFNPSVWWLLIGTNDLVNGGCSPEVVLLGILRIVEEIQYRKPDAMVVINGILPSAVPAVKRDKKYMNVPKRDKMGAKKHAGGKKDGEEPDNDLETANLPGKNKKPFFRGYTEVKDLRPTIKIINSQLKRFASHHDNVHFVDCTDIFVAYDEKRHKKYIDEAFLSGVHPTNQGHKEWAKRIVKTLDTLISMPSPLDYLPSNDGIEPEPEDYEGDDA